MDRLTADRETATMLAALRFWQREGLTSAGGERDVATDEGRLRSLSAKEIDGLCERITGGVAGPLSGLSDEREGNEEPRADESDATEGLKPTCPKCGSEDVVADAAARWTIEAPAGWEISAIFDNGHGCDHCGAEDIEFVWVTASPPSLDDVPQAGSSASLAPSEADHRAASTYRVAWSIDVEADSAHEAAASARATQLDLDSIATVFTVQRRDGPAICIDIESGEEFPADDEATLRLRRVLVTR